MFKRWIIALMVCSLFPFATLSSVNAESWQEKLRNVFNKDQERDAQKKREKQMQEWQENQRRDREAIRERETRGKQLNESKKQDAEYKSSSSVSGPANWAGTWRVSQKGGNEMTFKISKDGSEYTGTWSSAISNGDISLSGEGKGTMSHSLFGKCQINLTMSEGENAFTGEYNCRERQNDNARFSVKGKRKR